MQLTVPIPQNPRWLFFIFIFFFFFPSLSDPQTAQAFILCDSSKKGTIQELWIVKTLEQIWLEELLPNYMVVMEKVTKGVNESGWSAHFMTSPAPQIFIYAQCFDFISQNDCIACHTESRAELPKCFPAESDRIYLNGCYLRYDNYQLFEEALDRDHDMVKCGRPGVVSGDQYIGREFAKRVYKDVQNVTKTVGNMKFAPTGEKGGLDVVYAMAQCWKKLTIDSCQKCLSNATLKVSMCAPASDGMVLNTGRYLRYSTENFTRNGNE